MSVDSLLEDSPEVVEELVLGLGRRSMKSGRNGMGSSLLELELDSGSYRGHRIGAPPHTRPPAPPGAAGEELELLPLDVLPGAADSLLVELLDSLDSLLVEELEPLLAVLNDEEELGMSDAEEAEDADVGLSDEVDELLDRASVLLDEDPLDSLLGLVGLSLDVEEEDPVDELLGSAAVLLELEDDERLREDDVEELDRCRVLELDDEVELLDRTSVEEEDELLDDEELDVEELELPVEPAV